MLFSSSEFLLFFVLYFLLHLLVPPRARLLLIVVGSTIFYGYWNPYYTGLPHALLFLAFLGAHWIEAARGTSRHRPRLAAVVILLLLPLGVVKYTRFVAESMLSPLLGKDWHVEPIALPLGISFITFTLIAYVVDVYRGRYPLERSLARLWALTLFFPHVIAGPILRPRELLPQFARLRPPRRSMEVRILFGLTLFSLGLFKKLVFADQMSPYVDRIYRMDPGNPSAQEYLLAIYGFPLQIYCDFSGYTDMAIGLATLLGVRLPNNFLTPYSATSIIEFWRRWHMTLSRWLRDYVYIPLGGGRRGRAHQVGNLLITMSVGGLWHGASWTFVAWGLFHGVGLALAHVFRWLRPPRTTPLLTRWLLVVLTFHFAALGWILFRAPALSVAWRVVLGPFQSPYAYSAEFFATHAFPLLLLGIFAATHRWDTHRSVRRAMHRLPRTLFWPIIVMTWILSITLSVGGSAKFVYFEF